MTLTRLARTWRDVQVSGRGRLAYAPARYTVDGLELGLGDNRLRLSATLDDRLAGHFELAAPTLATLAPAVRGRLAAHGVLSGSVQEPALVAELEGADLGFSTWAIARADGQVDLDLRARDRAAAESVLDDARGHDRHGRVTTQLSGRPDARAGLRLDDPARAARTGVGRGIVAGAYRRTQLERPRFAAGCARPRRLRAQTVQPRRVLEEVSAAICRSAGLVGGE